jgi:hypothetical protein
VLTEGPVHLLAQPDKPLWPGPVAVVVENSPHSRPQIGLDQADMVVEMLAESEISRFLALYWSHPAAKIGPVRSARSTSMAVAKAYGAPYVHAGGSIEALRVLPSWGAMNLDEINGSGQYFNRTADREPPHNLYTTTALLGQAISDRDLDLAAPLVTPAAKAASFPADGVKTADIAWHRLHASSWQWDATLYRRTDDGEAHLLADGQQIGAANLIFLDIVGENRGPDLGWTLFYNDGGKATVLSAGTKWEGSWTLEPGGFVLKPAEGTKVPLLAPGLTWVHLITQESSFRLNP